MNHSGFGGFVERGGQTLEGRVGLGLFAGLHQLVIGFLERLEARFDGVVAHLFSGAAPNALLGGLGIRHISTIRFRSRVGQGIQSWVFVNGVVLGGGNSF